MMTITTQWQELGQELYINRETTIKNICDAIKVLRTTSLTHSFIFLPHESSILPQNPEMYYNALEALNENVNLIHNENDYAQRIAQIYGLLKNISNMLFKARAKYPPKLVRQYNGPNPDEFDTIM